MAGTLFVVATPIGNLEDITARALRILGEVALIAAEDTRRTAHLLSRYAIKTPTTSLHAHNEAKKSSSLVARLQRGDSIALVSDAGTPTVSDPGQRLIRAAIDAGIRVEAIPGASAALAALAASGIPAETFTFLGFPPTRSTARAEWLGAVESAKRPIIFFEAPHRITQTLDDLRKIVGDRTVAIGRELTKAHEEWVRGPISAVLSQLSPPRGEYTVVIEEGHLPDSDTDAIPDAASIVREFGELTANEKLPRRDAIRQVAKRHRVSARFVYGAIEDAKKSGV
jgi:16S rRNA (cytidine1402-2'-O)-methyltransferase